MLPAPEDLPCHQEHLVALHLLQLPDLFFPLHHPHRSQGYVRHHLPHHLLQVVPHLPLAPHPWVEWCLPLEHLWA